MTKTTRDIFKLVLFCLLIIAVVIFGPLVTIWALNTLFYVLAIPYNFYSWLAVVILNLTLRSSISLKKD